MYNSEIGSSYELSSTQNRDSNEEFENNQISPSTSAGFTHRVESNTVAAAGVGDNATTAHQNVETNVAAVEEVGDKMTTAHKNVVMNVVAVEEVGDKPTTTHPNVATSEKLSEIFTTRRFPVSPGSVFHRKQLDVEIHKEKLNSQSDPNLISRGGATDVGVSDATYLVNITDKEHGELEDSDEDLTVSSEVSTIRSFDDLIRIEKDDLALRPLPVYFTNSFVNP